MAEYIIKTKSKKEEKIVKAFLSSLDIDFYEEQKEEEGLHRKMQIDRKTPLIRPDEKESFVQQLKSAK
ncbi:MAG: hypothetical protein JWQ09_1089 [Segetibacter sp.]|nr:hypothetical protein [Segetibacter sp.]